MYKQKELFFVILTKTDFYLYVSKSTYYSIEKNMLCMSKSIIALRNNGLYSYAYQLHRVIL